MRGWNLAATAGADAVQFGAPALCAGRAEASRTAKSISFVFIHPSPQSVQRLHTSRQGFGGSYPTFSDKQPEGATNDLRFSGGMLTLARDPTGGEAIRSEER